MVKADGLAAGKGVIICETVDQAHQAVDDMLTAVRLAKPARKSSSKSSWKASKPAFSRSSMAKILPLASAQDHKRVGDGDTGPNTGGMGAYSPAPVVTEEITEVSSWKR